jgi:hypothetical protein
VLDNLKEMVVATRSRDAVAIFHFTDKIERSYTLNCENLPRSTITALQLVPAESFEVLWKEEPIPPLYLFVGYLNGYLFLLRCIKKEVKVMYRYNRIIQPESGMFSKTFSYFYSGNSNEYTVWQKSSVTKVVQRKQNLIYLLRNSIVVNLNNIIVPVDQLQVKFELIVKNINTMKKNTIEKADGCTYYICKDWRMVRNNEGSIIAFDSTISCMTVSDELIVMGSFEG